MVGYKVHSSPLKYMGGFVGALVGETVGFGVSGDLLGPIVVGEVDGFGVGGTVGGGQSSLLATQENVPSYALQHTGVSP